jgi:ABC-type Mn2+/Zn2+ transport system ATPase subunit
MTGRLEVREVSVSYDGVPALRDISFAAGPGEVVGIVGPNGAGKSTLVKAVLGLIEPDGGHVLIDGGPVGAFRKWMAYVPQRSEIDWDYPAVVEQVVAMGRYMHRGLGRRLKRADHELVAQALEQVGLQDFAHRQIGELSGGQQQRTFLARALAQQAKVLLLDEPLAGIDALTQHLIEDQVLRLRDKGATVLIVNHDLASVGRLYDKMLIVSRHMVAYGPPTQAFTRENISEAYGGVPRVAVP